VSAAPAADTTRGVHDGLESVITFAEYARERFRDQLISEYDAWMRDLHGLAEGTRSSRCAAALRFLEWLGERASSKQLAPITVATVDAYVKRRTSSLQRRGLRGVTNHLRSFLRHLHGSGRIRDWGFALIGPKSYAFEGIPSTLRAEGIETVLRSAHQHRTPIGLRDYGMLLLLSTYGLRAGKTTALRLQDIDWAHDRLQIRHSKTGVCSELPLLRAPAEAILEYLRRGRPKTTCREVFVC
jgi:integrase/recombinase XerD